MPKGRAGFVMANSASDARSSEQEIRQKLIEARAVDVMVAVGPNMFYTVTLPCTLWFFDKGKAEDAPRRHRALHRRPPHLPADGPRPPRMDARADRLPRQPRPPLSRRGPRLHPRRRRGRSEAQKSSARSRNTQTCPASCRAATLKEIEAQGWSLNPGRYVGVAAGEDVSDEDFKEQLETLNEELETLNAAARELESHYRQQRGRDSGSMNDPKEPDLTGQRPIPRLSG